MTGGCCLAWLRAGCCPVRLRLFYVVGLTCNERRLLGMAKVFDERDLKIMSATVPAADLVALKALARQEERSFSAEVRRALSAHLAAEGRRVVSGAT